MAVGKQGEAVRAYLEYFRDMGVHEYYRAEGVEVREQPAEWLAAPEYGLTVPEDVAAATVEPAAASVVRVEAPTVRIPVRAAAPVVSSNVARVAAPVPPVPPAPPPPPSLQVPVGRLVSIQDVGERPMAAVAAEARAAALQAIRDEIGDCTRCPLAYAGRRTIVFGDGDPNARLMFVGEGPGADEDESGVPFVGKAGQLLNNMIGAMGLKREEVYIANIVKCRPPGNRTPEPVEANTCVPFLAKQIDVVRPEFIVALGATAAMYLLGVRQSLGSLRGGWREVRGSRVLVTYHPAFLLRDPRQKAEAWKDLQMVMAEMKKGLA